MTKFPKIETKVCNDITHRIKQAIKQKNEDVFNQKKEAIRCAENA